MQYDPAEHDEHEVDPVDDMKEPTVHDVHKLEADDDV